MPVMPNGQRAAGVRHRVVGPVVQGQSAHQAVVALVTEVAQAVLAEQVAVNAHRPVRRVVERLRERLARVHVQVVVAREAVNRLIGGYFNGHPPFATPSGGGQRIANAPHE